MNYTDQVVYTLKDVAPADFINAFAKQLKEENKIKLPAWVDLVKVLPFFVELLVFLCAEFCCWFDC